MTNPSPPAVLFGYLRALLGTRLAALRASDDAGASAVELAVITAVLVGLAVLILGIIYTFAKGQANNIQNTNPQNITGGN